MKIIFSSDELQKILTDYVETMIDVCVTDVTSSYMSSVTVECKKVDYTVPQDASIRSLNTFASNEAAAGLTD